MSEKIEYQSQLLSNRLIKRYKHLRKWAKRTGITCFRLYDKDIPEIPLAIDIFETETDLPGETGEQFIQIALYERPYEKDEAEEESWLDTMVNSTSFALSVPKSNIISKVRKHQKGENQYEKLADKKLQFVVKEHGQRFIVNLSDYLDTGLFFDHRPLRYQVRSESKGKNVLNLYCYTGSFSVYAASGKAKSVTSVDLSKKYLQWAEENMKLNGFSNENQFFYISSDVKTYLENIIEQNKIVSLSERQNFDIIILDPPTFSNSKKTETTLDINRDWAELVSLCMNVLSETGVLYFSTNSRRLVFEKNLIPNNELISVTDITDSTIPEDYRNSKIHRAWKINYI